MSMTGYASGHCELPGGRVAVELRAVNSRFLDLSFRIPDDWRLIEPLLRESIARGVARGKVECRLAWQRAASVDPARLQIDDQAIATLAQLQQRVVGTLPSAPPLTIDEVLRWPGVLPQVEFEPAEHFAAVIDLTKRLLGELNASRQREGERLSMAIRDALARVGAIAAQIGERLPDLLASQQQRLTQRLSEALSQVGAALPADETAARVRQEIVAWGLRNDVAEELTRLSAHVSECARVLGVGGPVGKRLDFLCQELNREANTLGAKAQLIEQSRAAIDLKLAIEQIREQVQNLE